MQWRSLIGQSAILGESKELELLKEYSRHNTCRHGAPGASKSILELIEEKILFHFRTTSCETNHKMSCVLTRLTERAELVHVERAVGTRRACPAFLLPGLLAQYFSQMTSQLPVQRLAAAFRYENHMVHAFLAGVA